MGAEPEWRMGAPGRACSHGTEKKTGVQSGHWRAVMALGIGPATGVHGTGVHGTGVHGTGLHRTDAWVYGTGADDIREIDEEILVAAAFPCCARQSPVLCQAP